MLAFEISLTVTLDVRLYSSMCALSHLPKCARALLGYCDSNDNISEHKMESKQTISIYSFVLQPTKHL